MKFAVWTTALALAGAITLSACETNEGWGQLTGAVLGAGLGVALAGDDDDTVVALAALAGAGLGMWIGGNIGRGLDEKERQRVAESTQQMLAYDVPSGSPLRSGEASGYGAPSAVWTSPTNPQTVSGKSTLLGVSSTGGSGECGTVRQLVVKNGKETSEDVQFCRETASSQWQARQA
jgi:surface antigen